MCSAQDDAALPAPGFPIRKSTGQRLFSASPWLIAAVHVLLRLLVPRHPPHALSILTVINRSRTAKPFQSETTRCFGHLCSFQGPARKHVTRLGRARSLKTKQHAGPTRRPRPNSRPGRHSGDAPGRARGPVGHGPSPADRGVPRAVALGLPRKEVIQPHLPVRLPCYDFTPIAGPTFDGSLPCGLGHRLRVLLTFVV
jgi:hypothetical protein